MRYPRLEEAMSERNIDIKQIARCAHVDEGTARSWMREGEGQFPASAAFAVKKALFPECTIEELFAS